MSADIYEPYLMRIEEGTDEAPDIRTLKMTFQDEFRALLKKHRIEFDERYVWD